MLITNLKMSCKDFPEITEAHYVTDTFSNASGVTEYGVTHISDSCFIRCFCGFARTHVSPDVLFVENKYCLTSQIDKGTSWCDFFRRNELLA